MKCLKLGTFLPHVEGGAELKLHLPSPGSVRVGASGEIPVGEALVKQFPLR